MTGGFADRYGPWAVVTGAAQGMGAAFAAELAARGLSVLLVDRDAVALERTTATLAASTDARSAVVDLAAPDGADRVLAAAADLDVGLLVSNAAISTTRPFLDQGLATGLAQLDVNCRAPLVLVHRLLPTMVARGRGGIVLVSSLSAMRGTPLDAGYAASKAWNLILAESLWDEVREQGVDVLAVLPGPTRTPGYESARPQGGVPTMEPEEVVAETLAALGQAPSVIPGQANRDGERFMASLDRTEAVRLMGQMMRTMFPAER